MHKRRCVLCNTPLSDSNYSTVCFSHEEHPDYSARQVEVEAMLVGWRYECSLCTSGVCGNAAMHTQLMEGGHSGRAKKA